MQSPKIDRTSKRAGVAGQGLPFPSLEANEIGGSRQRSGTGSPSRAQLNPVPSSADSRPGSAGPAGPRAPRPATPAPHPPAWPPCRRRAGRHPPAGRRRSRAGAAPVQPARAGSWPPPWAAGRGQTAGPPAPHAARSRAGGPAAGAARRRSEAPHAPPPPWHLRGSDADGGAGSTACRHPDRVHATWQEKKGLADGTAPSPLHPSRSAVSGCRSSRIAKKVAWMPHRHRCCTWAGVVTGAREAGS